ncbi:hypothetical protein K450DRAFT_250735 [Umbelopsis ramanniana AG]|uniref:Uncharacterized protein n=1 Tax=Umbelopsis ramanniana AG TaxID=1314678 RepID=A0AAD5E8V4_UMBRA|nr:uncharacterized protein K450DRAFT_250735 [Umbelopsis ramanniana AG]KAI8577765.1 hypothetical protein K450DRAFT_250735 [Umbelopsis ramanniana AG]
MYVEDQSLQVNQFQYMPNSVYIFNRNQFLLFFFGCMDLSFFFSSPSLTQVILQYNTECIALIPFSNMLSIFFSVIAIASFVKPHTTRQSVQHLVSSMEASIHSIYTKPSLSRGTLCVIQIILHLASLVLFLTFAVVATIFDDVQDINCLPILSKRPSTADTHTSNLTLGNVDTPSPTSIEPIGQIFAETSYNTFNEIADHSKQFKRRETGLDERNDSARSDPQFTVPDIQSQEIPPPAKSYQEKENERPASVATTPLLTKLPSSHAVRNTSSHAFSQTPTLDSSPILTKSMPFHEYHREHPPAIALVRDASFTRGLHKRSVSTNSLALSISSQKSLSRVGSRVKRAFSKLNRRDGTVFPNHEIDDNDVVSSPDPKKRSAQKGLTRLLKRN